MKCFDPVLKVYFTVEIIWDGAVKVRKFINFHRLLMLTSSVAYPGVGWMRIFIFLTLNCTSVFVGLDIQVCWSLEVNGSLIHSCIVISILEFLHVGGCTLCVRMKSSEVEESTVVCIRCLWQCCQEGSCWLWWQGTERSLQTCLRPLVIGNRPKRTPSMVHLPFYYIADHMDQRVKMSCREWATIYHFKSQSASEDDSL